MIHPDRQHRGLSNRILSCFPVAIALLISGCGSQPNLDTLRKFDEAEQVFAAARSKDDFLRAASLYQEVLTLGFDSGAVFFNQGNAWFRAEEFGRAIAAYRQAEQQLPRNRFVKANLKRAMVTAGVDMELRTSLVDRLLFWQTVTSYREKLIAVTLLLAMFLICVVTAQLSQRRMLFRRVAVSLASLLVVATLSLARDWYSIEATQHAVLVKTTEARMGGSENYEPAFKEPLREGTEFIFLESNSDWTHVQVNETTSAWVPSRLIVTY